MFPWLVTWIGLDWLMKNNSNNTNNGTMNNMGGVGFNIDSFVPSNDILAVKKRIEGFRKTAYKSGTSDPVTVGVGLTYFCDGSKPVLGKTYDVAFLDNQLRCVSKVYIDRAKALAKKSLLVPVNQRQMDVLYYLFFNGMTASRQTSWLSSHSDNSVMANWMLSRNGIGGNFLVGADRQYFVGIITARYRLANYLMQRDIDQGLSDFLAQMPKIGNRYNSVLAADMYNAGKLKIPLFI